MATNGGNAGWQPLGQPKRTGAAAFVVTPFTRLARTHAATVAGIPSSTAVTASRSGRVITRCTRRRLSPDPIRAFVTR